MKKILVTLLSALLLAAPAALAAPSPSPSFRLEKKVRKTVTFEVNMHCKNCVEKLSDKLSFSKGVEDLKISLDEKTVIITYNPAKTDEAALKQAIEKCGYTAEKVETGTAE